MPLVRLIYASKKTDEWNESEIESLIKTSQERNHRHLVTGCLCFNRKYFMQCLEGSRSQVNLIYNSITRDKRHKEVELLCYQYIDERDFGEWDMHYVPDSRITRELILRFSGVNDLDPYLMTNTGALRFLKEAVKQTSGSGM